MGTRKKSAELVFNLQWRHKPDNGGDKSNVIGMYDTPTTTSNFEMFKSYLLKNSGVAGNDVKVTYVTDCGQEWVIDSQEWFEIALGAFRLKARLGEVIYLKLDKISNGRHQMTRKHSNDVETQFDVDSMGNVESTPPEWFLTYMSQFKREIVDEVTYSISANLSTNFKETENVPIVIPTSRKTKPEISKRSKKHLGLAETIDKDLVRTLKYDRKLENKLDKLDAKTKKIKEKKQALMHKLENDDRFFTFVPINADEVASKDSTDAFKTTEEEGAEADQSNTSENNNLMNGTAINLKSVQRMMGVDEIYLQTWQLLNNGKLTWSQNTELRLTWGSADLIPSVKTLSCPALEPGQQQSVAVLFKIPETPGTYESYWNFYNENGRFGQALSCCFFVEKPLQVCTKPPQVLPRMSPTSEEKSQQNSKINSKPVDIPSRPEILKPTKPEAVDEGDVKPTVYPSLAAVKQEVGATKPQKSETDNKGQTDEALKTAWMALENNRPPMCICPARQNLVDQVFSAPESTKTADTNSTTQMQLIRLPSEDRRSDAGTPNQVLSEESFEMLQKEEPVGNSTSVMDLSKRIENMKLAVDSDSDWESLSSLEKQRGSSSNKYGINERDLIVDLSVSGRENSSEKSVSHESKEANGNKNEDNNNNDSGSMIEEELPIYDNDDISDIPPYNEKEVGSGYVYITFDGNKLPVPRHILRPDFLLTAEEAPGPIFSDDERSLEKKEVKIEEAPPKMEHPTCESRQDHEDCTLDGASAAAKRLFIFPQNNPGYEVINGYPSISSESKDDGFLIGLKDPNCDVPTNVFRIPAHAIHSIGNPYGPLDQARSTSPSAPCHTQYNTRAPTSCSQQSEAASTPQQQKSPEPAPIHILPENLVSGAVNVASSAINTARSVINMIVPPRMESGRWVNGHWVVDNADSLRAKNLVALAEMGFWNTDLNASLLARYNDDLNIVINELLQ